MVALGLGLAILIGLPMVVFLKSPDYLETAHDTLTRGFGISGSTNWAVVDIAGWSQGSAWSRRHVEVALQVELSSEELLVLKADAEAFRETKFLHSPQDFSYHAYTNELFEPAFFPSVYFATNWAPPPFRPTDYIEMGKSDSSGYYGCRLYVQRGTNGAVIHALITRDD